MKIITGNGTIISLNLTRITGIDIVQSNSTVVDLANIFVFDWESDGSIGNLPINVAVIRAMSTTSGLGQGKQYYLHKQ